MESGASTHIISLYFYVILKCLYYHLIIGSEWALRSALTVGEKIKLDANRLSGGRCNDVIDACCAVPNSPRTVGKTENVSTTK